MSTQKHTRQTAKKRPVTQKRAFDLTVACDETALAVQEHLMQSLSPRERELLRLYSLLNIAFYIRAYMTGDMYRHYQALNTRARRLLKPSARDGEP